MKTDDRRFIEKFPDGQRVLFPTDEGWRELRQCPTIAGDEIAGARILFSTLEQIKDCPELRVGFTFRSPKGAWFWCGFLEIGGILQRVHVEWLSCGGCRWEGWTATPGVSDLYFGLPDKTEAMKRGFGFPELPCPRCGGKLPPRHPIWIRRTGVVPS